MDAPPGGIKDQVGWSFGQPDLVEGVPTHSKGLKLDVKSPSNPKRVRYYNFKKKYNNWDSTFDW